MATPKLDAVTAAAVDQARAAAVDIAGEAAVGEHLGATPEAAERVVTHWFASEMTGYPDWRWAVTMVRASRAKTPTVNEVSLLPTQESVLAQPWVPWEDRIGPGDITPGSLLPTPDNDPRLEPGFATTDLPVDADPADWVQLRTTVAELGLGRERVLSQHGRELAAERWFSGPPGPHDEASRQAPAPCATCGYFVALRGQLGTLYGACTNEYSPFDATVVHLEHGCGGHSDVVESKRPRELPEPVFDTIGVDETLFD